MYAREWGGESGSRMQRNDWLILGAYCLLIFSINGMVGPILSSHETVHCVNTREMIDSGDLIIPTYGGRIWLERPPLPFWITGAFVKLFGNPNADWTYRVGSIVMGLLCIFLAAGIAARWFGRGIGMLTGLVLATMREFRIYSSNSEADIFVCALVMIALGLFVRLEFRRAPDDRVSFLGGRPWQVLAFFVVLGMTNLTKGLIFGMMFILIPVGLFLLLQREWKSIRRYLWLWGWLAFLAAALPWPLIAYHRCPSILELWKSDYVGRWSHNYMREPWWYYIIHLPWNLFPWTGLAFLGLWLTRPGRHGEETDQRGKRIHLFLWCWAIGPVVWLSMSRGKHHHYLLHAMTPWAILGALGARRFWVWFQGLSWGWRNPAFGAVALSLPVWIALVVAGKKVPGPTWLPYLMAGSWPLLVGAFWWAASAPSARGSLATICACLFLCYGALEVFWDQCIHRPRYAADLALMKDSLKAVPEGERLLLVGDCFGPLGGSLWLHYLEGRAEYLHNLTFLKAARRGDSAVHVIARPFDEPVMANYGTFERRLQSAYSPRERSPDDRWTLYYFRFHDDLRRVEAPPIDAMQATGRAPGPFVE